MRELAGIVSLLAGFWQATAEAGFRTPESVVRNVYAHYGQARRSVRKACHGMPPPPRNSSTSLCNVWSMPRVEPYDFLVQSPSWKLGPVAIAIIRSGCVCISRHGYTQEEIASAEGPGQASPVLSAGMAKVHGDQGR
ncbi:hypothetical protein ACVW1A_007661 [Bradyrhizobium sp. LB1.3]